MAGHRLRTQVQPSSRARPGGPGGLALFTALVREGGIRIRSWDAAAPEPAPSIHTLVQLDGDTLLHVHPGALLLPELLAHHQREVSKTLARLHRSLGRLRVAVVSVGTSVGAGLGVSAWEWMPELLFGAWLQGVLALTRHALRHASPASSTGRSARDPPGGEHPGPAPAAPEDAPGPHP